MLIVIFLALFNLIYRLFIRGFLVLVGEACNSCLKTFSPFLPRIHHQGGSHSYIQVKVHHDHCSLSQFCKQKWSYAAQTAEVRSAVSHQVVPKLSKSCPKAVTELSQGCPKNCLKVVSRMSQSCLKVVSSLSQSCLKVVSMLCQNCCKVVPKMCQVVVRKRYPSGFDW